MDKMSVSAENQANGDGAEEVKVDKPVVELTDVNEETDKGHPLINKGTEADSDDVEKTKCDADEKEETKGDEKQIKKGLLDGPVVLEGKRERHKPADLYTVTPVATSKKTVIEASGRGTPLGDIEFVNNAMTKQYSEGLKSLHRLCYGSQGAATMRKKDLRKFNGYSFNEDSQDFQRKKTLAMKLSTAEVRTIRQVLGTESGHSKEDAVMNVLRFLLNPHDLGKKVPESKKRKGASKTHKVAKKKQKTAKGSEKKTVKIKTKKTKEGKKKAEREGGGKEVAKGDDSDLETREEQTDDTSGEESGDEHKGNDNEAKEEKIKISEESFTVAKEAKPKTSSPVKNAAKEESKESKWGIGGPSDAELDAAINELLRSVNLLDCTMKQLCQRISEKFPTLDMEVHKSALKARVKYALEHMED